MIILIILSEGFDEAGHPALMMKDVTAPCDRLVIFRSRGGLTYSQSSIEVKVVSCDNGIPAHQRALLDPVREHKPFDTMQLDVIRYHLVRSGISCRINVQG